MNPMIRDPGLGSVLGGNVVKVTIGTVNEIGIQT